MNIENIMSTLSEQWFQRIISVIFTVVIVQVLNRALGRIFSNLEKKHELDPKRRTMYPIIHRIIKYGINFIAFCIVLETIGIDTKPILAVTSIGSVAVGFGAQQLVKDVINGFFILSENQFNVGDIVTIQDVTGSVEDISLRTTTLRNGVDGKVYIIPNGTISLVTNMSKDYMNAVVNVPLPYEVDFDEARSVVVEAVKDFKEPGVTLEAPKVMGIMDYGDSSVTIRVTCKTIVGKNWSVEQTLRRTIKYALEAASISIPYPTQTLKIEKENEEA